jgi:uncharacterized paraquat-inducible protein A
VALVLAHIAPELTPSDIGEIAMTIVFVAALVIPFVVLGVVCWIFWKAKVREEAEREAEWPNARSS